jgi:16S rRNA processing protein RimM
MDTEYIHIGKIVNTHGNRGALKVFPLTDYPERFRQMTQVKVSLNEQISVLNIEEVSYHQKFVILKIREITDMNAALAYKNGFIIVERQELMTLPKGSYYIFELIGLVVYDLCGQQLGRITEVIHTGSNDVYVVETESKPLLVPALKKVVLNIDLDRGRMTVQLPEGLV